MVIEELRKGHCILMVPRVSRFENLEVSIILDPLPKTLPNLSKHLIVVFKTRLSSMDSCALLLNRFAVNLLIGLYLGDHLFELLDSFMRISHLLCHRLLAQIFGVLNLSVILADDL